MKKYTVCILTFFGLFLASPTAALAATLSLSPSLGTFNRGCDFSLGVELDTGSSETDGTDAIIKYDPTRFNAKTITSGTIYPDYPGNNIDPASGKITISGLASVSQAFTGRGTLARIDFAVLPTAPTGTTAVTFDFDPNDRAKTTDSNVVERGTVVDVLSSVTNGSYTVGTGTCASQTKTGVGVSITGGQGQTTIGATPSATKNPYTTGGTLPDAGSEQLTYTIAIVGSTMVVLGILGFLLL